MVKVQIPLTTPIDEDEAEAGEDGVGVMSDVDESDVDDDIADPDWEEVGNQQGDDDDDFSFKPGKLPSIPQGGVTIDFERPKRTTRGSKAAKKKKGKKDGGNDDEDEEDESEYEEEVVSKKKRKMLDANEMVRRKINRIKITDQLMKHKLSLLLYLARGLRLVKIVNCNIVKGLSMSVADNNFKFSKSTKRGDRKFLEMFMERFNEVITICDDDDKRSKHMQQPFMLNLLDCFSNLETTSLIECVVIFVACLKALKPKLPVRIVNVLRPITLRANIIPKPVDGQPMQEIKLETSVDDGGIIEKLDYWVEVFLADEKKWCCLDLCNAKLDEPTVLTELSRPIKYLVTYDVDRHCVKPAEKNYCEDWYTPGFRKGRCEDKWWDDLMDALGPAKRGEKDLADESKTEEILNKQEMPKSDTAFKNHPIYVLQKHLLKFEGIYPPEVCPLGFFKDQPVYPRDCVHTLRSRETWLRQARTVKLHETAYKVVKARPKRDKFTGELIRDLPLDLFGEWQTEPYDPPTAVDGKVPRNAYGNVDMYQPCMLPKGCVWLKMPGLIRVANKLKIDCAAAVTGFDNHCGSYGAHPVIEGVIVCEEFADTLQAAWEEEQVNIAKREEEKRQKRIWDNWRRLLKAAMIREKLRVKYKNT